MVLFYLDNYNTNLASGQQWAKLLVFCIILSVSKALKQALLQREKLSVTKCPTKKEERKCLSHIRPSLLWLTILSRTRTWQNTGHCRQCDGGPYESGHCSLWLKSFSLGEGIPIEVIYQLIMLESYGKTSIYIKTSSKWTLPPPPMDAPEEIAVPQTGDLLWAYATAPPCSFFCCFF